MATKSEIQFKPGKSLGFAFRRCGVASENNNKVAEAAHFIDENENLLNEIYAPDPNTGFPRSDIAVMLSRSTDPVVKEFISKVILSPANVEKGVESADVALEMIPKYGEDEDAYIARLKDIISTANE